MMILCGTFAAVPRTVSAASVTLAWDVPPDPTIVGFVITYGTQSGVYSNQVNAGLTNQATIANLTSGVTYFFVAQSYDSTGALSTYSNEVQVAPTTPVTSVALSSNLVSPQNTGETILWTAAAAGGLLPYAFNFSVLIGGTVVQTTGWTSSSSFAWAPTQASPDYHIDVAVRSNGSTSTAGEMTQDVPFTINAPAPVTPAVSPVTSLSVSSNLPSPQRIGTTIGWTASAAGGVAPYQFNWTVLLNGSVVQTTGWISSPSFSWTPIRANSGYDVQVRVRSNGSTSTTGDVTQDIGYVIQKKKH